MKMKERNLKPWGWIVRNQLMLSAMLSAEEVHTTSGAERRHMNKTFVRDKTLRSKIVFLKLMKGISGNFLTSFSPSGKILNALLLTL